MKDLGLSLSTGINSFAKGMELGERWKSRMDDDAWNAEVKNRQRAEWKATDDLRAKQNLVNTLQAAREASAAGIDFDPAPVLDAMKQAGQFGASIAQHFAEPEKVQNWVEMADRTIESGQGSPEALEALNWRFADQVNKGVGTTIEQAMQTEAGEIPAGSKIVGKRISTAVPSKSRNGLYFGLDVEVETPDGKRITYPAPMTVGRDTSPNAQVLEVPLESIFDTIEADKLILSDIRQDPKFAGAIRAALASLGSPVPADKFQTVSIEEGDEKVTYQVDARGNRKEIARAPLWKPEGATTAERNFARAQSDPAFAEYQERMKRAGATSVNVGGSEKEFDKNLGKQLAEQYGEIQKGAQSARSKIATLDALDAALQGAGRTGTGAKTVLAAKRAIGLFGGDPNVSDEEAVVALGNQLALQMRNPSGGAGMPGALSDKDREFLVASVPGIEKTAGGNRQLIDYMKRIEQRSIDVAKMADDYMRENGGRLDYAFYDKLAKWADANPLFPEASGGQAGPNVGHVEDGYVFKGGDPANPDSWERAK